MTFRGCLFVTQDWSVFLSLMRKLLVLLLSISIMSSLMDKCCCMLLHYNELLWSKQTGDFNVLMTKWIGLLRLKIVWWSNYNRRNYLTFSALPSLPPSISPCYATDNIVAPFNISGRWISEIITTNSNSWWDELLLWQRVREEALLLIIWLKKTTVWGFVANKLEIQLRHSPILLLLWDQSAL